MLVVRWDSLSERTLEDLEPRNAPSDNSPLRWQHVPASLFAFLGFFILLTSFVPFVNAMFSPLSIDAEKQAAISRTLAMINAAAIMWLIAGWTWYRGRWWTAAFCSVIGIVLFSVGLPDR